MIVIDRYSYEDKENLIEKNYKDQNTEVLGNSKIYDSNRNPNKEVEYYEVLSDGTEYFVLLEDINKICKDFTQKQLIEFDFKYNVTKILGKDYVCVTKKFLVFIAKNTSKPKYLARVLLLRGLDNGTNDFDKENIEEWIIDAENFVETEELEQVESMTR